MDGSLLVFVLMMKMIMRSQEIACELRGETPQRNQVQVIHKNEEE
jgi:hypothetical protein